MGKELGVGSNRRIDFSYKKEVTPKEVVKFLLGVRKVYTSNRLTSQGRKDDLIKYEGTDDYHFEDEAGLGTAFLSQLTREENIPAGTKITVTAPTEADTRVLDDLRKQYIPKNES